jgi:hypothetical protein
MTKKSIPTKQNAPQELRTIHDFTDEFLVVCPRCGHKAVVKPSTEALPPRLTCLNCGSVRQWTSAKNGVLFSQQSGTWPEGQYALGDAADPYFHLPLWLQISCCGHTIWAFNQRHLQYLRDFVAAKDRHTPPRETKDPLNSLLTSRLPKWMQLARNRDAVLHALEVLEAKLNNGNSQASTAAGR